MAAPSAKGDAPIGGQSSHGRRGATRPLGQSGRPHTTPPSTCPDGFAGLAAINYATIVLFVDMIVIALAALVAGANWINIMALAIFLAGTGVVAFGMLLSTIEVRTSHLAVEHDIPWALGRTES